MNKNKLVLGIVLLLLMVGIFYYNSNKKNIIDVEIESENKDVLVNKEVVNTTENVIRTYRSEKLGVEFDYALKDPMYVDSTSDDNSVVENGNFITTEPGGGTIEIFKKDSNVTFKDTLNKLLPSCRIAVYSEPKYITPRYSNKYMNLVAQVYLPEGYFIGAKDRINEDILIGQPADLVLSSKNLQCQVEAKKLYSNNSYYFVTSSDSADKIIGIDSMNQAPDGALYRNKESGQITTWMSTVRFIK